MTVSREIELSETPYYEVLSERGFWGEDETLHPAGTILGYTGTPNEQFAPLNAAARLRMDAFLDYLDQCHREKLRSLGRPESARPRDFADQVQQDNILVKERVYPQRAENVPLLTNQDKRKKRGRPANIVSVTAPAKPEKPKPPVMILSGDFAAQAGIVGGH